MFALKKSNRIPCGSKNIKPQLHSGWCFPKYNEMGILFPFDTKV